VKNPVRLALASTVALLAIAATPALAAGGDRYVGETDDGHGVKLVRPVPRPL
jgi:hypothetical protein